MRRKCEDHWQSIHGLRQAKGILNKPSAKKVGDLLGQSKKHLRIMTGLLTRFCHLKGQILKTGAGRQS